MSGACLILRGKIFGRGILVIRAILGKVILSLPRLESLSQKTGQKDAPRR